MRLRLWGLLALAALGFGLAPCPALAAEANGHTAAKAAIAKNAEAFVKAFHQGDAKAVAAFWTKDGDFTDQTGRRFKGRKAIEKGLGELFANRKGLRLRVESLSLRFITPDVAIEDGTTEVFDLEGGPPTRANYTMVHVKQGRHWRISSVRNSPFTAPSNYRHLSGLEWAIGDWAGEDEHGDGEKLSLAWTDNHNFIVGSFSTTARNVAVTKARQWIGWDPTAKRVRSWIFDATGGFGEGSWTAGSKKWTIKTSLTLQDGKKATATVTLARVDADTITLQAKDRSVDGEKRPDTKEIKLKRVKRNGPNSLDQGE
jgi:uncharacterized protein (TIGR02246 family)